MSRNHAAGTRFAQQVAELGQVSGFPYLERRVQHGRNDRGDLTGTPGITWQTKATKDIDLAEGTRDLNGQAATNGDTVKILVNKGRRKPTAKAYATVDLDLMFLLLRAAGFGQPLSEAEVRHLYGGSTRPPAIEPPRVPEPAS